jgi:hypothetical protein
MCLLRCGIRIWFLSTHQRCRNPPGRCGNLDLNNSYLIFARTDRRGFDLISEHLPFGRLWYGEPNAVSNAIGYARFYSRSHDAVRNFKRGHTMAKYSVDSSAAQADPLLEPLTYAASL